VRERVAAAARRAGRDPGEVRLVAVSKGVPPETVRLALEAGVTDLGESRVVEGEGKRVVLGALFPEVRWHLIGHLQTNKALRAARCFDCVHSVDSVRVATALSAALSRLGRLTPPLPVLVEVNVSGEETKYGVRPEETLELVRAASGLPGLAVRGLMTLAPLVRDAEEARPFFRHLAVLARKIAAEELPGVEMSLLSMGMSQDYEVAVEEGSTLLRIGTAIFGPREG